MAPDPMALALFRHEAGAMLANARHALGELADLATPPEGAPAALVEAWAAKIERARARALYLERLALETLAIGSALEARTGGLS